ncbi:hypothetical protein [Chryseobacterium gambrini]|uniref:Uncharacterized protein n=1 Tax=Chryseobacterium gambrini TaxID=373672 RepID=A0A1N7NYT4_9FLAO|nr:hypothetical protein [Chryseobacterium gambrini]SIT03525.1 hypothetical protein SAMN05421785_105229 [Chryseobacterium gambrini]
MVDKIKFIVENIRIAEDILQDKKLYTKQNKRKNKEWFVFDYKKLELLHFFRYKNEDAITANQKTDDDNDEDDDEKGYINEDQQFVNKNYKNLSIVFVRNIGSKQGKLIVHQNLRKDYIRIKEKHGKGILNDLDYDAFVETINTYALQFKISKPDFWNAAKITKIELGVTMQFKSNMVSILSCFGKYDNVPEKFIYGNSGISYKAENFSVSIYDKLKRALQNRELLKTLTKTRREEYRKLANKSVYYLRFELRVDSVSKFNQEAFKGRINTLIGLRENWDIILKSLHNLLDNISFADFLSPKMEKALLSAKLSESKSKADFDDFMYYLAIKSQKNMELFNTYISKLLPNQISSGYLKKIERGYNRFVEMEENRYSEIFNKKFEDKIKKLMKSGG